MSDSCRPWARARPYRQRDEASPETRVVPAAQGGFRVDSAAVDLSAQASSGGPDGSVGGGGSRGQDSRRARLVSRLRAGMRADFEERCLVSFPHAVILIIFALATLLAVFYGLKYAFDVAMSQAILGGVLVGVVTLVLNCIYITSEKDRISDTLIGLGPILAVAVIVGLFLFVAVTMPEFREDFLRGENARSEVDSKKEEIDELEKRVKKLQVVAEGASRRNVDEDPAVSPFFGFYQRVNGEFDKVDKEERICIIKEICVSYMSTARWERLNDLNEKRGAAERNLETVRLKVRWRIDRAEVELDKKEKELVEKREELKRIKRPTFRLGAFTSYTLREMKPSVMLVLFYVIFHMVPVMPPKDDARQRARAKRQNKKAASNRLKNARRDRIDPESPTLAS